MQEYMIAKKINFNKFYGWWFEFCVSFFGVEIPENIMEIFQVLAKLQRQIESNNGGENQARIINVNF